MLIAEKLFPIFLAHIKANQFYSKSVHQYDKKSGKVIVSNAWNMGVFRTKFYLAVAFISVLVLQFILYARNFSFVSQLQCVFFIVSYAAHSVMSWALMKKSKGFAEVVNSMLEFERKFNARMWVPKRGNVGKKVRHTLHPFLITPPIFASFVGTYLWQYPCFPGNFGFMFIEQCSAVSNFPKVTCDDVLISSTVIKVVLILFQVWMVNFLVSGGCYYAAQYLYCMCHCISNYLVMMCRKQLKEDKSSTASILKSYTSIRLFTFSLNRLFGDSLTVVVGTNTFLIILALYAILSANISLFQFIFLSISTIDRTLIVTEAFGTMGKVNATSKNTLMKIKLNCAMGRTDRLSRKLLQSFPQVMIRLGYVSYFDEMFATSNIDFVIKQTAGLLVI